MSLSLSPMNKTTRLILLAGALVASAVLAVNSAEASTVTVSWVDNSSAEQGFKLERGVGATPTAFEVLAIAIPANATTAIDTTAAEATTYTYRVRAYKDAIFSAYAVTAPVSVGLRGPSGATATTPAVAVLSSGQSITVKNSANATRPGSKTYNVAPGKQLLVSSK
jgi:hypothetical protein